MEWTFHNFHSIVWKKNEISYYSIVSILPHFNITFKGLCLFSRSKQEFFILQDLFQPLHPKLRGNTNWTKWNGMNQVPSRSTFGFLQKKLLINFLIHSISLHSTIYHQSKHRLRLCRKTKIIFRDTPSAVSCNCSSRTTKVFFLSKDGVLLLSLI